MSGHQIAITGSPSAMNLCRRLASVDKACGARFDSHVIILCYHVFGEINKVVYYYYYELFVC